MNKNLSAFLNFSRWFAAFMVLISHVRHLVVVDCAYVEQKTFLVKIMYFITGFGHQSVMVFFVISGFLVGGLTLDRWLVHKIDLIAFFSARISRLYTVFIPALIVGFAFDYIGVNWFNASELYTNPAQYNTIVLEHSIVPRMDISFFIGNFFMLQGVRFGPFGSNGPLWSLANEWWYYCFFGSLGLALFGRGVRPFIAIGFSLTIIALLPLYMLLLGSLWALGVATYFWIKSSELRLHPVLSGIIFALIATGCRLSQGVGDLSMFITLGRDFLVGLGFCFLLNSMSRIEVPFISINKNLADFSYSTYLFHFPFLVFSVAVGYQVFGLEFQLQPNLISFLYILGLTFFCVCFSYGISLITERYTYFIRRKVDLWFGLVKNNFI